MAEEQRKLFALVQFAMRVPNNPILVFLTGFLTGRLDLVRFVSDKELDFAPSSLYLSARKSRLWPAVPFQAKVGGILVPDPAAFVSMVTQDERDVWVYLEFGDAVGERMYQDLVTPAQEPKVPTPEEQIDEVREKIDHALDVYGECRRLMEEGDPRREHELQFFLETAKREIQELSQTLNTLTAQLETNRED